MGSFDPSPAKRSGAHWMQNNNSWKKLEGKRDEAQNSKSRYLPERP